jgi:hypothetical protein
MKKQDIVNAWATIRKENNSIPDDVLDFMKDSAIEKSEMLNWYNKIDYKAMFGNSNFNLPKKISQKDLLDIYSEAIEKGLIQFKEVSNKKKDRIDLERPFLFKDYQLGQHKLDDLSFQQKPFGFIPTKKSDYDGNKTSWFLNDEIAHWEEPKNSNYPKYTIGYSKFSNVESYSLLAQRSEYAQLQFISSKVNVNNQSKTFKEDVLAMARLLGANFLEEK